MNEKIIFSAEDFYRCKKKIGAGNQIAFGIMLAHFKSFIKFPSIEDNSLASKLLSEVAENLELKESDFEDFKSNGRTACQYAFKIDPGQNHEFSY